MANPARVVACPECDLLHRMVRPARGSAAFCVRCGAALAKGRGDSLEGALALHIAALILYVMANAFPLLALHSHGTLREASIPGCVRLMAGEGWPWLSAILLTTVILAPLAHLGGTISVLLQLRQRSQTRWTARIFRAVEEFRSWGMAEVFVLGICVSYVRLTKLGTVLAGPSLYALVAFMVVDAAAMASLDPELVWDELQPAPEPELPEGSGLTALQASLVACTACGRLSPLGTAACPRCAASLHSRKPESRLRTWAMLLTAAILYIPANALPMMWVISVGKPSDNTIMEGITYFIHTGSWPLAMIIFIASIFVPIFKLAILAFLLLSEKRRSRWRPQQRALMFRLTELVGRWSMLDVFVIILMVSMVDMGSLASAEPRPGAVAFALMVAATMLAARFFDPRLVWDALEPAHG